jgi:hypothetical protein
MESNSIDGISVGASLIDIGKAVVFVPTFLVDESSGESLKGHDYGGECGEGDSGNDRDLGSQVGVLLRE